MKQLYFLFFFICLTISSQNQIQIELVNENIGYPEFEGCEGCSSTSNDAGLNQIFQDYNATNYQYVFAYSAEVTELWNKIHVVSCSDCDLDLFLEDLLAYDTVINRAFIGIDYGYLYNGLSLKLVDENDGVFTGISNDIVTTNNNSLNQIFLDFEVRLYQLVGEDTSYEGYELMCDCNAELLKQELDDNSAILSTDFLFLIYLLSTEEYSLQKTKIYPNPFENHINIETSALLTSLELYDILGKIIYKTNNKSDFENYASFLNNGVYILKLIDEKNNVITKKIIKN